MRYSILFIFIFCASFLQAQDSTTTTKIDTSEIIVGKTKILVISDKNIYNDIENDQPETTSPKNKALWNGIQVGVNSFEIANEGPLDEKVNFLDLDHSRNRSISLNLFSKRWNLGTPYVGLSTGLGVTFNRYALNRNVRLQYDNDHVWAELDTVNDFSKNYLKTTHLTAPLFLEFNTKKIAESGFRLGLGVEAGYLLGAKTKVKYKDNGRRKIDKTKGNFNMNAFRLSPMAIIGYKGVSIYAKTSLTPFFIDKKGPADIYHSSVGLLFSF